MELKLKLKVKDVEIELTTEEAKKLAQLLAGLVGEKRVEYVPYRVLPGWWEQWGDPPWWTYTTVGTGSPVPDNVRIYSISDGVSVSCGP